MGRKNVNQLLEDILSYATKTYHLGTIILHKTKEKTFANTEEETFAIIDGQQRLVTLTLLLQQLNNNNNDNNLLNEPSDCIIKLPLLGAIFCSLEAESYIAYNKYLIEQFV